MGLCLISPISTCELVVSVFEEPEPETRTVLSSTVFLMLSTGRIAQGRNHEFIVG